MNEIFKNERFGEIRTAGTKENPLFCAVDVCNALGYANSRDAIAKHVEDDDVAKCDIIDSLGRKQMATFVNESGLYSLIISSTLPQARDFKHWVTGEILPSIRKTGSFGIIANSEEKVRTGLVWIEGCRKLLNLNDASTLLLMEKIAQPFGLPLPEYVSSKGVHHSASELLKKHGVGMSVVKFNEKLVEKGYLVEATRKGTSKLHKFKVISGKGLEYGENVVSPKNQNDTQPHWYDEKFEELVSIIK